MNVSFRELAAEIRQVMPDAGCPDEALIAWSKIARALQQAVASGHPDADAALAAYCEAMTERLYTLCRNRSDGRRRLSRRILLLPVCCDLLRQPGRPVDLRESEACDRAMSQAVSRWLHPHNRPERSMNEGERQAAAFGVWDMLIRLYAGLEPMDKAADPDFRQLLDRMDCWIREFHATGQWSGIADEEALSRTEVLSAYAAYPSEPSRMPFLKQVLAMLFERIAARGEVSAQTLFRLYDLLMHSPGGSEVSKADLLSDRAIKELKRCPTATDDPNRRLWLLALCIDRASMRLNDAIKRKTLAHSA